jgi:hypothetical protein
MVLHTFAAELPGYRGWRWAATVMRASRSKTVSVGETVLLPGPDSLLSPTWVPWTERLRPGDLGVGDLLPTDEDDPRLEPGWNAIEDAELEVALEADGELATAEDADADADAGDGWAHDADADDGAAAGDGWVDSGALLAVSLELDLLRQRVLSPIGLDDAIDRWISGDHGPDAPIAQSAPAHCDTCGFRIPLRGTLGHGFGICANEISPSDGHVVSLGHGCGAHSEAAVIPAMAERPEPVVDEVGFEPVTREPREELAESVPADAEQDDEEAVTPAPTDAQPLEEGSDEPAVTPELAVELGHG